MLGHFKPWTLWFSVIFPIKVSIELMRNRFHFDTVITKGNIMRAICSRNNRKKWNIFQLKMFFIIWTLKIDSLWIRFSWLIETETEDDSFSRFLYLWLGGLSYYLIMMSSHFLYQSLMPISWRSLKYTVKWSNKMSDIENERDWGDPRLRVVWYIKMVKSEITAVNHSTSVYYHVVMF